MGSFRRVNPSYRAAALTPYRGSAFSDEIDAEGAIEGTSIHFALASFTQAFDMGYHLDIGRIGATAIRLGRIDLSGRLRTGGLPIYRFTPEGSLLGLIDMKARIRSGP